MSKPAARAYTHRHFITIVLLLLAVVFINAFSSRIKNIFYRPRPAFQDIVDPNQYNITTPNLLNHERKLYSDVPKKFNPNFKAPCWYDRKNQLACLPYFYIAGFPKCGTTDLWFKILQHPNVITVCKEPHWWAWRQFGFNSLPTCKTEVRKTTATIQEPDSSIEWYLQFYRTQGAFEKIAKSSTTTPFHPLVFGDASISTSYGAAGSFFSTYELSNGMFGVTIPQLLYSVTPNVKIIMILRDPVYRYYSGYRYSPFGRLNGSAEDFHGQTVNAIECFQRCLEEHSTYYCAHHIEYCNIYSHGYLDKLPLGMYSVFIEDWLKAFPRSQIHFITLNELEKNPHSTLRNVFRFLELATPNEETSGIKHNKRPANSRMYGDMLLKTRKILYDFYRPYDLNLYELLNDTRFSFLFSNVE